MSWMNIVGILLIVLFLWKQLFSSGDDVSHIDIHSALIIDVRSSAEFHNGHISTAVNIPIQELREDMVRDLHPKERPVIVYCQSGVRAAAAAELSPRSLWPFALQPASP